MATDPGSAPLVLLVDDNEDNRELYGQILLFKGFRVETAVNGEEALEKTANCAPDVIVMDLAMPRMDGWEAMRRLRSTAATCDIPIIVLTAFASRDARERAEGAGCDVFLEKPFLPDVLEAAVRMMLQRRSAGSP
jgi:CheY-like chemotaxis protein